MVLLNICFHVSAVILPYYKNGKPIGTEGNPKDIIFQRHPVNRMPIDSWNDVWRKLHQQIVNVDVINVDAVPAEIYSTIAVASILIRCPLTLACFGGWSSGLYKLA